MSTAASRMVIFFIEAIFWRIRSPEVGAQLPFWMMPTVRFWRLWAFRSVRTVSMLQKMPALYVVDANTRWLQRNASATITDGWVADTSYSTTLRMPRSASSEARISAAFSVWP